MYFLHLVFFFFFGIKKISGNTTPRTQKEKFPKKHSKISLFFRGTFVVSHDYKSDGKFMIKSFIVYLKIRLLNYVKVTKAI